MSNREIAINLINKIPEYKLTYVISYLQDVLIPDDVKPNAETIEAIEELENGGGHKFTGSTEDLFKELAK